MLLARLLIIDQEAEFDRKLLRLELGHKVERDLDGSTADGTERSRLEGGCCHVSQHSTTLAVGLLGVQEGTGNGLQGEESVILGRIGDREDDSVGLTILDDCRSAREQKRRKKSASQPVLHIGADTY